MATKSITIQFTPATLQTFAEATELGENNVTLIAFKAVSSPNASGYPLLWYKTRDLTAQTVIGWQDEYGAYISNSEIVPNSPFDAGDPLNVSLGQTIDVVSQQVSNQGPADAISFSNSRMVAPRGGIFQTVNDQSNPCCVLQLPVDMAQLPGTMEVAAVTPVDTVLLMLVGMDIAIGTVSPQSMGDALLVEMAKASDNTDVTVSFDFNTGWGWDGGDWATPVSSNTDLAALLIQ